MANQICFYFQVHQPYRLNDLRYRDTVSGKTELFDEKKNRDIFRKVAEKCYLPTNALMLKLVNEHPDFHISYSLSGVFLDQCKEYGPDVLESFQALAATGKVEFLAETYYHSLSSIKSLEEFCGQVSKHVKAIETLFGQTPRIFRNTELIFNNEIAQMVRLMGFEGIIAEGADHVLRNQSPNIPYTPPKFRVHKDKEAIIRKHRPLAKRAENIHILLKNYKLSDDVAFRFSDKNWACHPLHADTYADWISNVDGHSVNLFMDYETFGEHQWEHTGIFGFVESLPHMLKNKNIRAATPSMVLEDWDKTWHTPTYDVHHHISWADSERDLSAWQGNHIQKAALDAIYALEADVKATKDPELIETWRKLQTSDHFYYMCTKYWADGDVHKYFSPYDSPYEAYRRFSHALAALRTRLKPDEPEDIVLSTIVIPNTKHSIPRS